MLTTIATGDASVAKEDDEIRLKIIQNICTNDQVFFRSQQIDDPDLTMAEKEEIVKELFNKKDSLFLERFGNFIDCEDLKYFEEKHYEEDEEEYIVRQQIEKLRRWHNNRGVEVRNRRYAAMQKMIAENSSYFTESEMMNREPLLYDQLVGRFLTEQEKRMRDNRDNSSLVNVLLNGMEDSNYKERLAEERKGVEDEGSSSSSSEASMPRRGHLWGEFTEDQPSRSEVRQTPITRSERDLLKQEFIGIMYTNFLQGSDKDFDYSTVDNNAEYDNDVIRTQDEEEKYFDADDDSNSCHVRQHSIHEVSSEDELDVFMAHLNRNTSIQKQL